MTCLPLSQQTKAVTSNLTPRYDGTPKLMTNQVDGISPNTHQPPYQILSKLDTGGRNEVYRHHRPTPHHITPRKTTPAVTLLAVALILAPVTFGQRSDADFQLFWGKFKTAVINSDKNAVASLSRFPIGMSYGIPSIKTKSELLRRYKEVFSQQTDAAKCFASKEPEKDPAAPRKYSVACPDAAGNEVVIYEFELRAGLWKFVRLDNINE